MACVLLLSGCAQRQPVSDAASHSDFPTADIVVSPTVSPSETPASETPNQQEYQSDIPDFTSLDDPNLLRYVEDNIYEGLVDDLNNDGYFVENVSAVYVSKEYLDEVAFNSQSNIFFGYTLEELNAEFQGKKYVFTLTESGETGVKEFEAYDNTYEQVIKNVAIGTGVILVCVTVSAVTSGVGAPAVSMIFAASAKTGTIFALSSGAFSGIAGGVVTGIQTGNFDEAVKAGVLAGSESFKWGAITGVISGGASEAIALKGATLNGLTMNEAAVIQRESKYPLDLIKSFHSTEEYNIYKAASLEASRVNGQIALTQKIDWDFIGDIEDGRTNAQRVLDGLAPLDPTGNPYELHHIGQKADSPLAVLTSAEHRSAGNSSILHQQGVPGVDHGKGWQKQKQQFWEALLELTQGRV